MEKIQFVDLKAQQQIIGQKIREAMDQVMTHGQFIMGPEVFELESQLQAFTGSRHVITCASGTDALLMALMALGVGPGDAVFTTPFTFVATAEVVCLLGAVPVFVDVDDQTWTLDPVRLDQAINRIRNKPKTESPTRLTPKCIIPVDIFGLPADYEQIRQIADMHGLSVIADGAQSLGSRMNGQMACTMADLCATSFFPAKPLGCYGDGGAVFTDQDALKEKLVSIRVHGKGMHKYDNVRLGINGRLDTLQAAILIEKLSLFSGELAKRADIAAAYQNDINATVQCQKIPHDFTSAWAQFSFLSSDRSRLKAAFDHHDIPYAVYYPTPLHLQKAFERLGGKKGDFPVAEMICQTVLSIPMHPYLSDEQISWITRAIRAA